MSAGIATRQPIKSPLLLFHETLSAQPQAFTWEKLVKRIPTQRHPVWQSSEIIAAAHTSHIQTQRETLVPANVSRLHKKTPQEKKILKDKMSDLYREDFT